MISVADIVYGSAMRTLVDLPQTDLDRLAEMASRRRTSRAALVREAVEDYLARHGRAQPEAAFGLWTSDDQEPVDGLAYQDRLRAEW